LAKLRAILAIGRAGLHGEAMLPQQLVQLAMIPVVDIAGEAIPRAARPCVVKREEKIWTNVIEPLPQDACFRCRLVELQPLVAHREGTFPLAGGLLLVEMPHVAGEREGLLAPALVQLRPVGIDAGHDVPPHVRAGQSGVSLWEQSHKTEPREPADGL